ncbi:MAG: hypothetical protein Q8Q94_00125 [bacterium]|nr:hypothetical protein [bacterium]MDZ4299446.1 hypothetical protein [Candidatus Sungbacteria bacterium]
MRYAKWSVVLFIGCVLCSDPLFAENDRFTVKVEPQKFSERTAGFVVSCLFPQAVRLTVQVFWQDPSPPRTLGRVGMDVQYPLGVPPHIMEAGRVQFYQNTGTPQQKLLTGAYVVAAVIVPGETKISISFSNGGLEALEASGFEAFTIFAEITGSKGNDGLWKTLISASLSIKNIRAVKEIKPLPSPPPHGILPKQDPALARPKGV